MPRSILLAAALLFGFSAVAQESQPTIEEQATSPADDGAGPEPAAAQSPPSEEAESAAADRAESAPPERADIAAAELTPAEQKELAPTEGTLTGQIGAGFLATDGNSQSRSANGKFHLEYKKERWKNTFDVSAVNNSADTGTAAERYLASDKVDYLFYAKNYAFLVGEYEKDLFGGTRTRTSAAIGVGRHFLTGPLHLLDVEIGVGGRRTESNAPERDKRDEAIARLSGKYEWKLTDRNTFSELLKSEAGEDNTFTESVTSLKLHILGSLSSALSYTVRHNSDVPPERERVDTETAINVVYDFGRK